MIIPVRLAAALCRPMMGLVALFAVVGICSAALNAQDAANRETTKISVASPQLKTVTLTQRCLGQVLRNAISESALCRRDISRRVRSKRGNR